MSLFGRGKKRPGVHSAEALVTIAANYGCEVDLKWTGLKGEKLEFRLSPGQATNIREGAKARRADETSERDLKALNIADSLASQYGRRDETEGDTELRVFIAVIASILSKADLKLIATNLDRRGLYHLAATVRAETKLSKGTEPH